MKYLIIFLVILLASCNNNLHEKANADAVSGDTLKYQKPVTLKITGDFNGDGKKDEISQFIVDSTGKRIGRIIDFQSYDITDVAKYFDKNDLHVRININNENTGIDTGYTCGLYCLINIGDSNNDGKDEVAFVPDSMDFSRHNYCHIFTLCSNGWADIFNFSVHEGAFEFESSKPPIFKHIPGALEYKSNKWYYLDYLDMDYNNPEDVGQMLPLAIPSCKK